MLERNDAEVGPASSLPALRVTASNERFDLISWYTKLKFTLLDRLSLVQALIWAEPDPKNPGRLTTLHRLDT